KRTPTWAKVGLIIGIAPISVPALLPFSAQAFPVPKVCYAITSGWASEMKPPSKEEFAAATALPIPAPGELNTPAKRAAYAAAARRLTATTAYKDVAAWDDWATGPGACVPEARHRLILSAWL